MMVAGSLHAPAPMALRAHTRQGSQVDTVERQRVACPVLSIIGRGLVIFALCLAVGLDRVALQSVAWTTMLVTNVKQTSSLAQAVARTFNGQHPCDLCKRISSTRDSQKKSPAQPVVSKLDLICTARSVRIISFFQDFHYAETAIQFSERGNSPPVPPPRATLA